MLEALLPLLVCHIGKLLATTFIVSCTQCNVANLVTRANAPIIISIVRVVMSLIVVVASSLASRRLESFSIVIVLATLLLRRFRLASLSDSFSHEDVCESICACTRVRSMTLFLPCDGHPIEKGVVDFIRG